MDGSTFFLTLFNPLRAKVNSCARHKIGTFYEKNFFLTLMVLSFCLLFQSCELDFGNEETSIVNFIGTWQCENASFECFDNLGGLCTVTFGEGGSFSITKEFSDYWTLGVGDQHPYVAASGEWILESETGKIFTTAKVPEKFYHGQIVHTVTLSHAGENIVFNQYQKKDPLTLIIDGNTFTKQ